MLRSAFFLNLVASCAALRTCNVVVDCGALADNHTNLAPALSACVAIGGPCGAPGSTVVFPANTSFLSGSIDLSNTANLTLQFSIGSSIFGSSDPSLYPLEQQLPPTNLPSFPSQWRALIHARNASGLTIEGPTSAAIDGLGWPWWAAFNNNSLAFQRPKLVEIIDSSRVSFRGMTFRNSPFWTLHTLYCNDVRFISLTVLAPRAVGNTDGIDPDSCSDVLIDNCLVDVGDDGISLKSDFRVDPRTGAVTLVPTARVVIRNTTVLSRNVVRMSGGSRSWPLGSVMPATLPCSAGHRVEHLRQRNRRAYGGGAHRRRQWLVAMGREGEDAHAARRRRAQRHSAERATRAHRTELVAATARGHSTLRATGAVQQPSVPTRGTAAHSVPFYRYFFYRCVRTRGCHCWRL